MLERAGFVGIEVIDKENSADIIKGWGLGEGIEKFVYSAYIKARKPD
jgi:hypothetical protein